MTNSKFLWWNEGETKISHSFGYWRNLELVSSYTLQQKTLKEMVMSWTGLILLKNIFLGMSAAPVLHRIEPDLRRPSDHALVNLPIAPENTRICRKVLKHDSEKESAFLSSVIASLKRYRLTGDRSDWHLFCSATRSAKRSFFDNRIAEIASTNKRPWDLMSWVKQHKLPAVEAIQYQGSPCNTLPDL